MSVIKQEFIKRTSWWVVTGLAILVFLVATPDYYQQLNQVCSQEHCLAMQLNLEQTVLITQRGWDIQFYANLIIVFQVLLYLTNLSIGIFLYSRKAEDWLAILLSLMLLTSLQADFYRAILQAYPEFYWPASLIALLNSILIIVFFHIFPTGSFQPRWTRFLAAFWIILIAAFSYRNGMVYLWEAQSRDLIIVLVSIVLLSSISILIYRYLYILNRYQREQTRWVVFGVSVTLVGEILLEIIRLLIPVISENAIMLVTWNLLSLTLGFVLPISILFAVLSSALLDIDVLIRRTLAYTALTIILLIIYVISVLGFQRLFELVTGQRSALAAIVSTLLIAASFTPLRQKIQDYINRTFYRQQYNTEIAFQELSQIVREDVDLDQMSMMIAKTIQNTLQPEFLSVWICRVNPELDVSSESQIR